jgi:serine/threonine-protein kinase
MAPEQILGRPIDGRVDQFSLAVMAYRMLTGVRPFEGDTVTAIMYQIVNGQPKSMLECNKELKPPVADIVAKALSKDPENRYATCSEFARALVTGVAPAPAPAPPSVFAATQVVSVGGGAAAAVAPARVAPPPPAPAPAAVAAKRSGSRVLLYVGIPLAAAAAAVAVYMNSIKPAPPASPQQQPASVVQTVQPQPAKPAARKSARPTAGTKARSTASKARSTAPAKDAPAPDVELIDDTQPAAPNVPRVFDKR